jgi:hypothetical protein
LELTPDIQIIRPAQKEVVSVSTGGLPHIRRESVDTATVLGFRLLLIF